MNSSVGSNLGNAMGGMVKAMNDIADHYEGIANEAGMTDSEIWARYKKASSGAPPPYALPPYVLLNSAPLLDFREVGAEARAMYKLRSPWGFLVREVFLDLEPAASVDEVVVTRPRANMSARMYASHVVDLRIAREEEVGFPNNLNRKQRARIKALDPSGEKTAKARERQAANIAAKQKSLDPDGQLLARAEAKLADGDVVGYWTVLAEERPLADLALRVATNQGLTGALANDRLQMMAVRIFGQEFTDTKMAAIRFKIAQEDRNLRRKKYENGNGIGLTSDEVITYHKKVFEDERLPKLTFAPEALAKVVGPLWSVALDASTDEVLEDGVMLTVLKVYASETAQMVTDYPTFLKEWVQVVEVAVDTSPTLGRYLEKTLDAAHEAMIDVGQELIDEPSLFGPGKRIPTSDGSPAKEYQLIVWYHFDTIIGHFFVELRPKNGESEFFGKYPYTTSNYVAEQEARKYFNRKSKIARSQNHIQTRGLGKSISKQNMDNDSLFQEALRELAIALHGQGGVFSAKDKKRFDQEANRKEGRPDPVEGSKVIKLTLEEYDELRRNLILRQQNPTYYSLFWDNCATLVQDVLGSRVSVEYLFPIDVRIRSLAGVYVTLFGNGQ
jgi:hypothetical protein